MLLLKDFHENLNRNNNANSCSVYTNRKGKIKLIYGEAIETITDYAILKTTKIFESATGIKDDRKFKSRLVTQIFANDTAYIFVLSSYNLEAFNNEKFQDILLSIMKLKKELIN